MAGKSTLYRPLRLTVLHGTGLADVALNPTGIQSVGFSGDWKDPATGKMHPLSRVVLKDHDAPDIYVVGETRPVIEAWEAALRGGPLTSAEWGYTPDVPAVAESK